METEQTVTRLLCVVGLWFSLLLTAVCLGCPITSTNSTKKKTPPGLKKEKYHCIDLEDVKWVVILRMCFVQILAAPEISYLGAKQSSNTCLKWKRHNEKSRARYCIALCWNESQHRNSDLLNYQWFRWRVCLGRFVTQVYFFSVNNMNGV